VLIALPEHAYQTLSAAQDALDHVVVGVGGLKHSDWRKFYNEQRQLSHTSGLSFSSLSLDETLGGSGFIDGDFLELILDMDGGMQQALVDKMNENLKGGEEGKKKRHSLAILLSLLESLAALH